MANVRNLIIGCDGTWNDTDETALTNVAKLLNACTAKNQVTHYEEGVVLRTGKHYPVVFMAKDWIGKFSAHTTS